MATLKVKGAIPLTGTIKLSGSIMSALKLIHATLFSGEDVILENVPNVKTVLLDLQIIETLGAHVTWLSHNKLLINSSGVDSSSLPKLLGAKSKTAILLAAPLVFRFGKAVVPIPREPIDRLIEIWKAFGITVEQDEKFLYLFADAIEGIHINIKTNFYMETETAILCALVAQGETIITNAAEESEIDDLIAFCNSIGGRVERTSSRTIQIIGTTTFTGGTFKVQADKNEAAFFATAALITRGNVSIKGVNKPHLLSFVHALTKIGCNFEFSKDDFRVWDTGSAFNAADITTAPYPGFVTEWQPLITLLLTRADGVSLVHETSNVPYLGFVKDLNTMGAKIELLTPFDVGLGNNTSVAAATVARVTGPTNLKGAKLGVVNMHDGLALLLASLGAEGSSSLFGFEILDNYYDDLMSKLSSLGAQLELEDN